MREMAATSEILSAFGVLSFAVVAILLTRRRRLVIQIAAEVGLVGFLIAFLMVHASSPLPGGAGFPAGAVGDWYRALAVIWWLIAARLVVTLTLVAHGRDPRAREARLFSELIAVIIYLTAVLIILNSVLNLPVNSILATSGVIAIVLGLALQSTLSDVFAGIAVGLERPFHLDDRVSLGSHIEGVIVRISWRSITIRTDGDDLVTMPNSIVAKGQIINRSVPTTRRAVTVEFTAPATAPSELILELMRHASYLSLDVMKEPPCVFTIERSGVLTTSYAIRYYVADTPTMTVARSSMLRQIRRLFYHAGVGRPEPLSDVDLLASLVIFEALSRAEVETLAAAVIVRSMEPGDVMFEQGTRGTSIYIVQGGVLEATRSDGTATSNVFGHIGPGEYIGELGLIVDAPREITVRALTRARVLELPGDSLTELLRSNRALDTAMAQSVRRGLAHLDRDAAARASHAEDSEPDLFARIKAFFKH